MKTNRIVSMILMGTLLAATPAQADISKAEIDRVNETMAIAAITSSAITYGLIRYPEQKKTLAILAACVVGSRCVNALQVERKPDPKAKIRESWLLIEGTLMAATAISSVTITCAAIAAFEYPKQALMIIAGSTALGVAYKMIHSDDPKERK
jgi:hypothetical protein